VIVKKLLTKKNTMSKILSLSVWVGVLLMPYLLYSQQITNSSLSVHEGKNQTVIIQWNIDAKAGKFSCLVEKSADKKTWEGVTRVENQFSSNYSAIDSCPFNGSNYYRIKLSSSSGQFFFTDTQCLQINNPGTLYTWPNPANEVLHIRSPFTEGTIDIFDAQGKFVKKITLTNYITDVHIGDLPKGMYFLHLTHNNYVLTKKFVRN